MTMREDRIEKWNALQRLVNELRREPSHVGLYDLLEDARYAASAGQGELTRLRLENKAQRELIARLIGGRDDEQDCGNSLERGGIG